MIDTFACMVRVEIAECVRACQYFSVQADESKDVSKTEQLALVLRFCDEAAQYVQECFVSFTNLAFLDAAHITDVILRSLGQLGLGLVD